MMINYWEIYLQLVIGTIIVFITMQWMGWSNMTGYEAFMVWWGGFTFTTVLCLEIWIRLALRKRKYLINVARTEDFKFKWWHTNERIRKDLINFLTVKCDQMLKDILSQTLERNTDATKAN